MPTPDPIKRNSLVPFTEAKYKATSKQAKKIKVFQNKVILFGQQYKYISMQCTTDLVTWQSSLHMRYSPSLSQSFARFIWQVRSLSCCSVLSRLDRGGSVRAVFVDYQKAFDRVDHTIVLHKLVQRDVPHFIIKWMFSFLESRQQRVKINDRFSNWTQLFGGMPQGSWPTNYGTFVLKYFRSQERKYHWWNFRSLVLSLPETFILSRRRRCGRAGRHHFDC